MKDIVSKIEKIEKLFHARGCSNEQVEEAEKKLGLTFPEEYISYVRKFGAISFYATEWTGLNVSGRINVVDATMQEREINANFPKNCFVLENQAIDGMITAVNSEGSVFLVQYGKIMPLCNSISEYLDQCVNRR